MQVNGVRRAGEMQLDHKALMTAERALKLKSFGKDSRMAVDVRREDASKTTIQARKEATVCPPERSFDKIQEVLKLHNVEREEWKAKSEMWKAERHNWKLTVQNLKDDARHREQQFRNLSLELRMWKKKFITVATTASKSKDVTEVCKVLLEQLKLEEQNPYLQRSTGDAQRIPNSKTSTTVMLSTVRSPAKGAHSTPTIRTKEKGEVNKLKVDQADSVVSQKQLRQFEAESAQLKTAASESKKLEEVCSDLRCQLEQRNLEIRRTKVALQKASKWQALARQKLNEHEEKIKRLTKAEVGQCIICMNNFGEDLEQQRAYWKDCNHANICVGCTKALWKSNKKNCPTCRTPSSTMPIPLPPKIYF